MLKLVFFLSFPPLLLCSCRTAPVTVTPPQRENNLVEVLHTEPVGAPNRFCFSLKRPGWVYLNFIPEQAATGERTAVRLDDGEVRLETMRRLSAGPHRLILPDDARGVLTVKHVPEIYLFAAGISFMPEVNGYYDYRTLGKYYLASTNLLHPGNLPTEAIETYRAEGRELLDNVLAKPAVEGDIGKFLSSLARSRAMRHGEYSGFTVDEFNFTNDDELRAYPEALTRLGRLNGKKIHTWIYGDTQTITEVQRRFVKAALETPEGGGEILFEAYCPSYPTQSEAERFLDRKLDGNMRTLDAIYPGIAPYCGFILGNFNLIPYISLDHFPFVDYKYYLDMQMHRLANDPAFRDLAMVGFWGSSLLDEDLQYWSLALLRHYCVEGKRTMLSDEYGYTYLLPYLTNNDFRQGLKDWHATVAPDGAIFPASDADFPDMSMGLWQKGDSGAGEHFIVFRRGATPNYLSQTARELRAGQIYMLEYVTADYQDIKNHAVHPMDHVLHAELPAANAEVLSVREAIDRRPAHFYGKTDFARINLKQIVFKALTPELPVTFTDHISTVVAGVGKIGQEKVLTFVRIKPYFAPVRP